MGTAQIGEYTVGVLGVDFGEEVLSSGYFTLMVHIGCIVVSPWSQLGQKEQSPFQFCA